MNTSRAVKASLAIASLSALVFSSACGSTENDPSSSVGQAEVTDGIQARIDQAKGEGKLKLILGVLVSRNLANQLADGFKKYYNLDIPVEVAVGVNNQDLSGQVVQSIQAGVSSPTDVQMNTVSGVSTTIREKITNPLDWSWAPNIAGLGVTELGDANKQAAVRVGTFVQGFTYNTARLSGDVVPKTLADVLSLDDEYALSTTPFASGFGPQFTDAMWGVDKMFAWAEDFATKLDGFIDCGEVERIASGEFDMQVYNCGINETISLREQGAPVDYLIPSDVPFQSYYYMQIPPNAASPAAAELFINWMLSPEAQKIMWEESHYDLTDLKGSQMAIELEPSFKGRDVLKQDIEFVQANQAVYEEAEAIEDIFTSGSR